MTSTNRQRALQAVLAFVCVGHLVLGLCAFVGLAGPVKAVVETFYGASLDLTPQLQHVIRMLGAFMLAIAVLAGLAAFRPSESRPIVIGLAALLLLRVAQRIGFAREVQEAFGVTTGKLWLQSLFFLALAAALLLLRPTAPKGAQATD